MYLFVRFVVLLLFVIVDSVDFSCSAARAKQPGLMYLSDDIVHSKSPADSPERSSFQQLLQSYVYAWVPPGMHLSYNCKAATY